jgi:hypothetical protein
MEAKSSERTVKGKFVFSRPPSPLFLDLFILKELRQRCL